MNITDEQLKAILICAKLGHTTTPQILVSITLELSALREELAALKQSSSMRINQLLKTKHEPHCVLLDPEEPAAICTCTRSVQQRLTAAEQRNAELLKLLARWESHTGLKSCNGVSNLYSDTRAALKPTESGASE